MKMMIPQHVAIIMDGNNRWAQARGLEKGEGHVAGEESLRAVIRHAVKRGIAYVTVFAFSSENWQRPQEEVDFLMHLFVDALENKVVELHENNIKITFIGERSAFSSAIQESMQRTEKQTQANARMTVNIALNYGGQWDICQAARALAQAVKQGDVQVDDITPERFGEYVALSDQPPVDLCIRTAGEQRISNFLLWQMAYAEFYFSPVYWPDFLADELDKALADFSERERRFGQTSEQIQA